MGNLLVAPITDKETHRGEIQGGEISYAVSSMQGWRIHMEDAHILQGTMYAEELIPNTRTDISPGESDVESNHEEVEKNAASGEDDRTSSANTISASSSKDGSHYARGSAMKKARRDSEGDGTSSSNSSSSSSDDDGDATEHTSDNQIEQESMPVHSQPQYQRMELPQHSLFAVFDGHGGSFAAEYSGLNFVRVLARQASFVQYAKFVKDWEESEGVKSCNVGGACAETNNDDNNTTDVSMGEVVSQNNKDPSSPQERANFQRKALGMLETALKDAFLDIDREIWRATRGLANKDSILPFKKKNQKALDVDTSGRRDDSKQEVHQKFDHEDDIHEEDDDDDLRWKQTDSGTTAIVVMLTPMWIVCANAGDSRSVYSKQGNCTIPLSYDHKPDDEAEERRIYEAGGFVRVGRVEGDLAVSRGFGDFRFKKDEFYEAMDTGPVRFSDYDHARSLGGKKGFSASVVSPEDQKVTPMPDIVVQMRNKDHDEFIILACDGIFDVQTNHECVALTADIFREGESDLGLVCEEILDVCLEKGSKDNMTALIIKMPAQKIGSGGGVAERRRRRQEAKDKEGGDA